MLLRKKVQLYFTILAASPLFALDTADSDFADNARFDGFSANPSVNTDYAYAQYDFTGVGWYAQATSRQFALVSPQHFVCATHFRPAATGQVKFLGSDGNVYTYEILNLEVIKNANGNNTDLTLGTLETVVDTRVIERMKYANQNPNTFSGSDGMVFGKQGTGGNTSNLLTGDTTFGALVEGSTLPVTGNIANTTFIQMNYTEFGAQDNDAYVQNKDSGSPAFIASGNEAGLVSTNSLVTNTTSPLGFSQVASSVFVPEYESQLSTSMANEGYKMSPLTPQNTSLNLALNTLPELQQGYPGSITFTLTNTGNNEAGNISVTLNEMTVLPDTFSAPDYFTGLVTSESTERHTATLAEDESDSFTVTWEQLPATSTLSFDVTYSSDESGTQTETITLDLLPSFLVFTDGLIDASEEGDNDFDGIPNLLEYALGGDPFTPSQLTASGSALLPTIESENSSGFFTFLRRTNAEEIGLTYTVESTETLLPGSWDNVLLADATVTPTSDPDFEEVAVPFNDLDKVFYRLIVSLDE